MKKQLFSTLALAAAVVLSLSSCGKEDTAAPLQVDYNRTATIQGKILIKTDETVATPKWSAPSNVSFIATVPYSSLNSGASGTYVIPKERITYDSQTGVFTVIAPVSVQGTAVTVSFSDFKGEVRKTVGADQVNVKVIWKSKTQNSGTVYPGETRNLAYWELQGASYYIKDTNVGDNI